VVKAALYAKSRTSISQADMQLQEISELCQ